MIGYTRAHRDRFDHQLFRTQKFCRGYAWDWLIAHAAFKPHDIEIKGKTIRLERGQLSYSLRYIATAWNWEKDAVSRLLARLKTEAMIETNTATGQLLITICNYDAYQADVSETATATETGSATGPRQDRDRTATNKNKGKNGKKVNIGKPLRFEEFWDNFPHRNGAKKGKGTAKIKYVAAIRSGVPEEILVSKAKLYNGDRSVLDGYGKGPTPWLNQKCWNDDIDTGPSVSGQSSQADIYRRMT